jgi:uncharacterized protein (UPF0335 family)
MSDTIAAAQLKSIISRIETLEEQKRETADDIKEVYAEARSNGYDVKVLRRIIRERRMDARDLAEQEAILDTYRHALGMLADTPLGKAAIASVSVRAA